MKRDSVYFLVTTILIVGVIGFLIYDNIQLNERLTVMQQDYLEQFEDMDEELRTTRSDYKQRIGSLTETVEEDLNEVRGNLGLVEKSIKQEITALSGELTELEVESEERFGELASEIVSIDVKSTDFTGIINDVIRSTVSVRTNTGLGSGVVVDARGFIVTNYHVIEGATAASVVFENGNSYGIALVGYSDTHDLALIKIVNTEDEFRRMRFTDSDNVDVGEKVIAVGNPGGLDFTVTEGIISAKNRIESDGTEFLQHDVSINPGNSGGPLIGTNGRIVGINTKKVDEFEGIGFAIASNLVKDFVDEAISQYEALS